MPIRRRKSSADWRSAALSVAFFAWAHARAKPPEIRLRPVVVAFAALAVLLNGHSLNAEPLIRDFAYKLRSTMNVCAPSSGSGGAGSGSGRFRVTDLDDFQRVAARRCPDFDHIADFRLQQGAGDR